MFHEAIFMRTALSQGGTKPQGQTQKRKGPRSGGMERGPTERSSRWSVPASFYNLRATGGNLANLKTGTTLLNISDFPVANMNKPFSDPVWQGVDRAI